MELLESENAVSAFSFKKTTTKTGLSPFIPLRATDRSFSRSRGIPEGVLDELRHAAGTITMDFVRETEKISTMAGIAAVCERIRLLTRETHNEYFGKTLRFDEHEHGIHFNDAGIPPAAETAYQLVSDYEVAGLLNDWAQGR